MDIQARHRYKQDAACFPQPRAIEGMQTVSCRAETRNSRVTCTRDQHASKRPRPRESVCTTSLCHITERFVVMLTEKYIHCLSTELLVALTSLAENNKQSAFKQQIVLAVHVSRRMDSPMAMGLTSPFGLGRAISLDEEKRVTAASGSIPLAKLNRQKRGHSQFHHFPAGL